jgi:4-hydroxybenzoate polyprenyltransferase
MEIIIYIFAASFIFMALALMITYRRTKHYGVFLLGLTYGAAAGLAIVLTHWWPLAAGFVLVWLLRLLGLDPDTRRDGPRG